MEVRESTSEKNQGREYYYCSAPCTGCPDVEHGFSHFVDETKPRFPKTEAKRIKEEQKRDSQALAQANPAAALDQGALEGRLAAIEHQLHDQMTMLREHAELLRILVARSNGSTATTAAPVSIDTVSPAMIPAKRQKTDAEAFAEWKAQQDAMQS